MTLTIVPGSFQVLESQLEPVNIRDEKDGTVWAKAKATSMNVTLLLLQGAGHADKYKLLDQKDYPNIKINILSNLHTSGSESLLRHQH